MPLNDRSALPDDLEQAVLVGRAWCPDIGAPCPVAVIGGALVDVSSFALTTSTLLEQPGIGLRLKEAAANLPRLATMDLVLANSAFDRRDPSTPWLIAPCDLQAVKASGVTFVESLLERVIEERSGGDASRADEVRARVMSVLGDRLASVRPGSAEAEAVRHVLIQEGMWSQYLEVGIGPDAEIFTKAQPMSVVGTGSEIGIHENSQWNNPEPEIVLAVTSRAEIVGAALGNDVNLRDFEGRSALLLGKAKDNNASASIGPFIRLFDSRFGLDDVRAAELSLRVEGTDGYVLTGASSMKRISRDPTELVAQAMGSHHQYPDGMMLYLGTLFAPTADRSVPGQGFTHQIGDTVTVSSPRFGALINTVNHSHRIAPWEFGVGALLASILRGHTGKAES
ncbi:fumarylacetoacetate hydrolase family protein [Paraburkholderia sp. MM5477-R1]|uniref:fumarylacetoacetate hydrolase family protein n=1 Tax=Paraburkholderia sp. MM5477-R1 TaxID=2991062 RepID=UPI003D1A3B90